MNMQKAKKAGSTGDIVYGIRAVFETIRSGKEVEKVLIQHTAKNESLKPLLQELSNYKIPFQKVPAERLNKITRKNHQGVICFLSSIQYASLEHVIESCYASGKDPFILVLDRITDVRNFGGITRTAECAGIDAIVVPGKGNALISSDAMKTSAGALNYIPVCRSMNLLNTITWLKDSGVNILACTEKTDQSLYDVPLTGPLAIIMGSEQDGISAELMNTAHQKAKIPLTGKIASLNVSVSAAIAIYEALRQRTYT